MPWIRVLVVATVVAVGCSSSVEPTPAVVPSETEAPAAGNLPPGCQPINLRTPTGEMLNVEGVWVQDEPPESLPMTWYVRTEGNCLWGSGSVDLAAVADPISWHVQTFEGHITDGFVIEGGITQLGPEVFSHSPVWSEARFFIAFDDLGQITLHEDREPGARGPRCPEPHQGVCPDPLVLIQQP